MIAELVRFADKEGLRGKSRRSISEYLAKWYGDHSGGKGPHANTVRKRFSRYLTDLPEEDDN